MTMIRLATAEDEAAIVALWVRLLAYHRSIEPVWPRRWTAPPEVWPERLVGYLREAWRDAERQAVLVAVEGEAVVGFVRVGLYGEGPLPARIETLFVAESHRGAGLGRALMAAGEEWCVERGAAEVGVEFIARNSDARQVYERLGYRPFLVTYMRRLPGEG
ncbi:MAG TPA: GNAT family N-acetyltransferase [Chloroflexota bacterium]|jgi:GNAT superfamily N-acetyltransferase|nr:GNAT family N-acetyltransferase [Chloroflexota bacterium]